MAGTLVGYAPMLAMFALIPGMARRYLHDKVLVFWRRGGIDLPRRAPLPWRVRYAGLSRLDRVSQALVGLHFLIVPLYCAGVLVWALLTPGPTAHPALVGAALVGLFHAHHAMSRSDLPHLCQGIQPGLLAILAGVYTLAAPPLAWVLALALTGVALLVIRRIDPALQALEDRGRFVPADIRGERLWLPAGAARQISRIQALIETHLTPDEPLFIAPDRATLYPLLGRPAPVRSDMMIFPETEAGQDEIVAALDRRGVNWALVWDAPRDGRDELRFSRTHAKVWAHLEREFEPVPTPGLKVHWAFRKRRMQETET